MNKKRKIDPIHPGEILLEEFLLPMKISQYRLAKEISVSLKRVTDIVQGRRGISADTALRLGRYFEMAPEFWLNLQTHYELEIGTEKLADRLTREVQIHRVAA